jgi:hypothetical protein
MTLNVRSGLSQFHIAKTCKNENHNPAIKKYKGSAKMTCKLQLPGTGTQRRERYKFAFKNGS